ncbi:VTT domain-containing protein [Pelagibacteraceae bacterium]|nr:VTT domain-containing protein [Pelagibacteraceae bacterium]
MSKNFKLFLGFTYLLLLAVFLYFIFSNIQINRLNDFSYYKELQVSLDSFVSSNLLINIIYFFVFSIIWVSLLGFGAPILILSGILFGKWIGTSISVLSISLGALTLYSIANFFFSDIVKNILEKKYEKYVQLFQKNEFYYFFIYRFIGGLGVPFFLQNVLPVLFNMKKINYFFSSFFGFVPGFFIFNTIGAGLNTYIEKTDEFSFFKLILTPEIYFPILMFISFIILSFIIKNIYFKNVN